MESYSPKMRVSTRTPEPPAWLAILVVSSPLLYGLYRTITDWPTGALGLLLIIGVYAAIAVMVQI